MRYRREIDGLRAVAVVPVILFHAGFSAFSGGFVGVDVFFVISGYLITTILLEDREAGRYSLLGFYERRARRILPALFLVLAVCLVPAWLIMPPYLFEDYARSTAFAALFLSNVHFWEHSDYFATETELQPLLHTWSLAVEEQFYLLFPLLLLPLGLFRRTRFLSVFGLVAALSLLLSEWGWRNYRDENFFFTFSRLWELLAGSICAALLFKREIPAREWLAATGLGLIVLSIFAYNDQLPFPSLYTVAPVGGTMLIILFAGPKTLSARLLSLAPLVGIGLISYSAYLWHQPLFAFSRIWSVTTPPQWVMVGLAIATLVLAYFSWRYVEQPFRRRPTPVLAGRTALFGASLAGIAGFVALGLYGFSQQGFPSRLAHAMTPFYEGVLASFDEPLVFDRPCSFGLERPETYTPICVAFEPEIVEREIAVLGDSHLVYLLPGFEAVAAQHNARILAGGAAGCPHLLGVVTSNSPNGDRVCYDAVQFQAEAVVKRGVDAVVLVARWQIYSTGVDDGRVLIGLSRTDRDKSEEATSSQQVFELALADTIAFYQSAGIPVIIMEPVPELNVNPRHVIESVLLRRKPTKTASQFIQGSFTSRADHELKHANELQILRSMAGPGTTVVSIEEAFADREQFVWLADGAALYFDDNHLTVAGARRAGSLLAKKIDKVFTGQSP